MTDFDGPFCIYNESYPSWEVGQSRPNNLFQFEEQHFKKSTDGNLNLVVDQPDF